jgi:hypothetical protein
MRGTSCRPGRAPSPSTFCRVLVFVLAVTQAAIRSGRDGLSIEETLTLADLRAAVNAMREVETSLGEADAEVRRRAQGPMLNVAE